LLVTEHLDTRVGGKLRIVDAPRICPAIYEPHSQKALHKKQKERLALSANRSFLLFFAYY
jgi:hypothetical protein